ncbi:hypothetical protein GCM10027291_43200 [Telluribacter humicola]
MYSKIVEGNQQVYSVDRLLVERNYDSAGIETRADIVQRRLLSYECRMRVKKTVKYN